MQRRVSMLLPIGVVLILLGFGNWYTGFDKGVEYQQLVADGTHAAPVADFEDFTELNGRTVRTLMAPLLRGSDEHTLASAKLDFYEVVQSGGRMLMLLGLFCAAAGLIRSWHRRVAMQRATAARPS
jgi:hypothetical protein